VGGDRLRCQLTRHGSGQTKTAGAEFESLTAAALCRSTASVTGCDGCN
jgi:hypothetical protein